MSIFVVGPLVQADGSRCVRNAGEGLRTAIVADPMSTLDLDGRSRAGQTASTQPEEALRSQPRAAMLFVAAIIAAGAAALAFWGPRHVPNPVLFATLLAASALASSLRLQRSARGNFLQPLGLVQR